VTRPPPRWHELRDLDPLVLEDLDAAPLEELEQIVRERAPPPSKPPRLEGVPRGFFSREAYERARRWKDTG
jgi:hypothetical protein